SSIGANYISGVLGTINGASFSRGATISVASTTLLGDTNTFTGADVFSSPLSLTSTTGTTTIAAGQGFTIGGSLVAVQQGSGRVGIGTTSPGFLFSIAGISNWTTSTSTLYSTGGINIQNGCFAINGACISGGSGTNFFGNSGSYTYLSTGSFLG